MSGYEETVEMINDVIYDVARWHLENDLRIKDTIDKDMIEDWIYEVKLTARKDQLKKFYENYWAATLS